MIVDPGHAAAHLDPPVRDQALIHQLVEHRIQRALLGFDPAAAPSLRLLHQLVAVHILSFQQCQDHQGHDTPAKAGLIMVRCQGNPPLRIFIIFISYTIDNYNT